jgi:hypothetical protein
LFARLMPFCESAVTDPRHLENLGCPTVSSHDAVRVSGCHRSAVLQRVSFESRGTQSEVLAMTGDLLKSSRMRVLTTLHCPGERRQS